MLSCDPKHFHEMYLPISLRAVSLQLRKRVFPSTREVILHDIRHTVRLFLWTICLTDGQRLGLPDVHEGPIWTKLGQNLNAVRIMGGQCTMRRSTRVLILDILPNGLNGPYRYHRINESQRNLKEWKKTFQWTPWCLQVKWWPNTVFVYIYIYICECVYMYIYIYIYIPERGLVPLTWINFNPSMDN